MVVAAFLDVNVGRTSLSTESVSFYELVSKMSVRSRSICNFAALVFRGEG